MQSSMLHFCDECGAANAEDAATCVACQRPLSALAEAVAAPAPVAPVKIVPTATLQVVAGAPIPVASGPLKPGTVLAGRYRILREIGQGGFGSVYLARDPRKRGHLVAIKQIDLGLLKPREIIEATDAFNREITFLSTLSHPHLPKIYGHFTDASHWYLVMQYIKGQTLEEYLRKSRHGYLPTSQVLKIGLALTDVLGYLHSRRPPVIFRDLKPANILLTNSGHVYLIDFGIARRFAPEKTKDTGPLGSPGYAAPEQYGRAQTDARTDIYALGATLRTLFTGRDPLELRQGLPPLRPDPLPEELQSLIDSMLEPEPAKRPARVNEIEERFAWWSRRTFDFFAIGKGMCTGLFFWVWYELLALGINIIQHTDFSHVAMTPFKWRVFLIVLNIFPLAVTGAIIYQFILLIRQKRQQQAICVLIILAIMVLFALPGWLPSLFQGYPFHTYNPDLSQ